MQEDGMLKEGCFGVQLAVDDEANIVKVDMNANSIRRVRAREAEASGNEQQRPEASGIERHRAATSGI